MYVQWRVPTILATVHLHFLGFLSFQVSRTPPDSSVGAYTRHQGSRFWSCDVSGRLRAQTSSTSVVGFCVPLHADKPLAPASTRNSVYPSIPKHSFFRPHTHTQNPQRPRRVVLDPPRQAAHWPQSCDQAAGCPLLPFRVGMFARLRLVVCVFLPFLCDLVCCCPSFAIMYVFLLLYCMLLSFLLLSFSCEYVCFPPFLASLCVPPLSLLACVFLGPFLCFGARQTALTQSDTECRLV